LAILLSRVPSRPVLRRALYLQAARFTKDDMASLSAPQVEKHLRVTAEVQNAICALK
jgi:hypothetical protein